jgi:hypothetical protein
MSSSHRGYCRGEASSVTKQPVHVRQQGRIFNILHSSGMRPSLTLTFRERLSLIGVTITAMERRDMLGKCFASGFVLRTAGDKTKGLSPQHLSRSPKYRTSSGTLFAISASLAVWRTVKVIPVSLMTLETELGQGPRFSRSAVFHERSSNSGRDHSVLSTSCSCQS